MKRKDILRKLEERLARGEINEKTYLEIKARYESEPDEPEESEEAAPPSVDLGSGWHLLCGPRRDAVPSVVEIIDHVRVAVTGEGEQERR